MKEAERRMECAKMKALKEEVEFEKNKDSLLENERKIEQEEQKYEDEHNSPFEKEILTNSDTIIQKQMDQVKEVGNICF